jgi:hypothetical protein
MQGHSEAFDETLRQSHRAVSQVDLIADGKVIRQLEVHAGSVTADRTAAQMRSFSVDILDRDGTLLPTGMSSDLAPFGARVQLYRGVRISSTETIEARYDATHPWTAQTATGAMNGVTIDVSDGGLILGP